MTKTFQFYVIVLVQILIFLTVRTYSFSQSKTKISYGDLDTNRISVEEFINQRGLKASNGLIIDSAIAYFSIPGQKTIIMVDYLPKFDSVDFYKYSSTLAPGAVASFEIFVTDIVNNKKFPVQLNYFFYSMTKKNISFQSSPQYLEWKKLRELNYLSGTIYFSGTFFSNVVVFSIQKEKSDELKKLFDGCSIGTVITFENISYKDDKGNLVMLNDSFKL